MSACTAALDDVIVFVNGTVRRFFTNVGGTRRQGVGAGVEHKAPRWF